MEKIEKRGSEEKEKDYKCFLQTLVFLLQIIALYPIIIFGFVAIN